MGSACCGGSPLPKDGLKPSQVRTTTGMEGKPVDTFEEAQGVHFPAVQFDVVVPENSGATDDQYSMSLVGFDQTMRDEPGASMSGGLGLDPNMSFTNNFKEVNEHAVQTFLNSVMQITNEKEATGILEKSISLGRGTLDKSLSLPSAQGFTSQHISQEDNLYIHDGATLADRLLRLNEVEETDRLAVEQAWNTNMALMQLAVYRVVPTIRQRRQQWNSKPPVSEAAAGEAPAKKKVLTIHAPGVEPDTASLGSPAMPSSSVPAFSPASPGNRDPATSLSSCGSAEAPAVSNLSMSRSRRLQEQSKKIEHYELLALTCQNINLKDSVKSHVEYDSWDFLSSQKAVSTLNSGSIAFRFMCGSTANFDSESTDIIRLFINHSAFDDEEKENNTPKIDIDDPEEKQKYIAILVKAMYMLPGARLADITPELVASTDYQKACQPGGNKIEPQQRNDTFRLVMTIIKFVFSMTIQFRVSEITDPETLATFRAADGMTPAKAIMLERTKRDVSKVDSTAKARSMLLYYPVNGGVLVNSQTIVMNTALPKVVSKLVNTFGSQGASQSAETASLTRTYMVKRFGDSRKK